MRILVGWEDAAEADLIAMYLDVDDNHVVMTTTAKEFIDRSDGGDVWDVILMSTVLPDEEQAIEVFEEVRRRQPDSPIVGACKAADVFSLVKFMTKGMNAYVIRDGGGDYMFMMQALLTSTVEAVRAERERQLAQRLREEVESVRKLQKSVIPSVIKAPTGYEICARYEPSQIQVVGGRTVTLAGGDYYDVFSLDDNNVVLLVGDASGHGMKAAVSIMTMHTLVRMIRTHQYVDTAVFMSAVNDQLADHSVVNDEGGFITLLYAILNLERHELQWSSSGHPVPMLQDMSTGAVTLMGPEDAGGLPLAIMPNVEYDSYISPIPEHSRLLLCTDGLEEAFPEGKSGVHQQFGIDGISDTMKKTQTLSLDEALNALFHDSNAFTQGSGRHDDTSVVFLERA